MEIINEASDKFKDKQAGLCEPLFEMLRELSALEREIYEREQELKARVGIVYKVSSERDLLRAEYRERYDRIVSDKCTERLLKRGSAKTLWELPKYGYVDGGCTVNFIMKSAKKALIETRFIQKELRLKQRFVLKCVDEKWLVDEVYCGFESDNDWSVNNI